MLHKQKHTWLSLAGLSLRELVLRRSLSPRGFLSGLLSGQMPTLLLIVCSISLAAAQEPAADARLNDARARAQQAIGLMQGQLKQELAAALSQGGNVASIRICRERAPQIAADISRQLGVQIRRTSERWRNPVNAPDSFESGVLRQFAAAAPAARELSQLRFEEVLTSNDGDRLHVMQAIAVQEPCLLCHGEALAEPIRDSIRLLYPNDHAIGFRAGELRGAFSVSVPITSASPQP